MLVAMSLGCASAAEGDADTIAKRLADAFGKACSAGDVAAVAALYLEDASAIFPAEGAAARGRAAIEALAKAQCDPSAGGSMRQVSASPVRLGPDHIANVGRWELSIPGADGAPLVVVVRTSEVLVHTASGWKYLVDHASIGLPPAPAK